MEFIISNESNLSSPFVLLKIVTYASLKILKISQKTEYSSELLFGVKEAFLKSAETQSIEHKIELYIARFFISSLLESISGLNFSKNSGDSDPSLLPRYVTTNVFNPE